MRGERADNSATPVNTNTLSQQVYSHLRAGILDNTYRPGAPLPEEAMAEKLHVSRVPVREALRRLSAEGLVVIKPRQGATVTELTAKQFLDAYQVREALEVLAVRLAVPRLTPADLAELDALQEAMQTAAAAGNSNDFFVANADFHGFLVDRSDNGDLKSIYDAIDTSSLMMVREAIEKQNSTQFASAYKTMLESCYSCHKAAGKPMIRPQIPTAQVLTIVNLDPAATWPQ